MRGGLFDGNSEVERKQNLIKNRLLVIASNQHVNHMEEAPFAGELIPTCR